MSESGALSERAEQMRLAFDRSFAEPIVEARPATVDFVSIRLGGEAYAVRMADIVSLRAGVSITPCPSALPELLGIVGLRGVLVPVYDLAALLGHPPSGGRWLVLAGGGALAFAFDEFDDHFRILAAPALRPDAAPPFVLDTFRADDRAWAVIDLPALADALAQRAAAASSHQES